MRKKVLFLFSFRVFRVFSSRERERGRGRKVDLIFFLVFRFFFFISGVVLFSSIRSFWVFQFFEKGERGGRESGGDSFDWRRRRERAVFFHFPFFLKSHNNSNNKHSVFNLSISLLAFKIVAIVLSRSFYKEKKRKAGKRGNGKTVLSTTTKKQREREKKKTNSTFFPLHSPLSLAAAAFALAASTALSPSPFAGASHAAALPPALAL